MFPPRLLAARRPGVLGGASSFVALRPRLPGAEAAHEQAWVAEEQVPHLLAHPRLDPRRVRRQGSEVKAVLRGLAEELRMHGKLHLTEAYVAGSHAGARGGPNVGRTRRGKASTIISVANRSGLPVAVGIANGQRDQLKLVVDTLNARIVEPLPEKPIEGTAYDSDPLDT